MIVSSRAAIVKKPVYICFGNAPLQEPAGLKFHRSNLANQNIFTVLDSIKKDLKVPFAMEILIIGTWSIWICRNNEIFNNQHASMETWKAIVAQELRWVLYRIKKKYYQGLKIWIETNLDRR